MLLHKDIKKTLNDFFIKVKLQNTKNEISKDKQAKIDQILAYLEVVHSQIRGYSKKRDLVFIDSCAGNCHLSFLVYFYYTNIDKRNITIHCIDRNEKLMDKNSKKAKELGFDNMFFHSSDIDKFECGVRPDLVYSLHACDTATDKTIYFGLKNKAKNILSVSCCQFSLKIKNQGINSGAGMTRNKVFKDKLLYMIGDSLRSLLLQMQGYKVDVVEFVSSRATDKNVMLRARTDQVCNLQQLHEDYVNLQNIFHVVPALEKYVAEDRKMNSVGYQEAC